MKKKIGLTSVEAAALYLSEGRTKDPNEAALIDQGKEFDMDTLTRASLRRKMGFDFELRQRHNKVHVSTKEGPRLATHAKIMPGEVDEYGNIIGTALIERIVDACIRLKVRWEEVNEIR